MRKIVAENSKLIEEKKIEDNIRKVEKKLQGKSQDKDRNNTSDWTEISISEEGINAFPENKECVNFITKNKKEEKKSPQAVP